MPAPEPLYFDDLSVGDRWVSPARTVTESDVIGFANLTGDRDPLHVDHEYARSTPFRQPIAHGLLGLSLVAGLNIYHPHMKTEAFTEIRQWKFLKPIYFGDTVRAVAEVVELGERRRKRGTVIWRRQLINQKDEVVQEGILETVVCVRQEPRGEGE